MASTRVMNYISYKRFIAASTLKNLCILSNFNRNFNFRQNALYCTNKPVIKPDPVEQKNKVQVGFAHVGKFHILIYRDIRYDDQNHSEYCFYFSQGKYRIYRIHRCNNWRRRHHSFHVLCNF